jgi:RimJ/RimL family protein N-acetyltransferase
MNSDVRIVDLETHDPSDAEILSWLAMMKAPDQLAWEYDASWAEKESSPQEEIEAFRERRRKAKGTNYPLWAMAEDRVIGMIGINRHKAPCRNHCGELGFGVLEAFARRGIGYRLVQAAIAKAREVGLRRLEADCLSENEASRALLVKCGFGEEGVRVGAICRDGRLRNLRLFGLLLEEDGRDSHA